MIRDSFICEINKLFLASCNGRHYDLVYLDPHWDILGKIRDNFGKSLSAENLKNISVPDIVYDRSLLFMWSTSDKLNEALDLGKAWGFEFVGVPFIWKKQSNADLSQVEFVLLFKHGNMLYPRMTKDFQQIIREPVTEYWDKPVRVIEALTERYPNHEKIELFMGKSYFDWDSFSIEEVKDLYG